MMKQNAVLWLGVVLLWHGAAAAVADEKLVLLDEVPRSLTYFEVAADGARLYFGSGSAYFVFDAQGKLADKFGLSGGAARELVPLPNGWFIAFNSHASGHIALFRPDGTPVKQLVRRGGDEKHLRHDMTGWTSPTGGAVDVERKRIFALDSSMAQRGFPDPWWSRIAIFDLDGKYVGDISRYDGKAKDRDDAKRTWYDDIEIDTARRRVYVTARRTRDLLAFGYDGKPVGRVPGRGGIAVFPDGRVAVGSRGGREIQIYDAGLKPLRVLPIGGLQDLEADASGRLYASVWDPSVAFIRWSSDLEKRESFGPRFRRIRVDFPSRAATSGQPFQIKVKVEGRPPPAPPHTWQVMIRPSDGSELRWRRLPASYDNGALNVTPPKTLRGFYEVAVRFGRGPIALADRRNDLYLQKAFTFRPPGATRSIAVITASGRRAFRQGEPMALHLVRRDAKPGSAKVKLDLEKDGAVLSSAAATVRANFACEIPSSLTAGLVPGRYLLKPTAKGHEGYPLTIHIAPVEPDSPMQRILYHEFDNEAITMRQNYLADTAERMAFIRDYAEAAARLGFSRETDRLVGKLNARTGPNAWRRDYSPVPLKHPAYAPPEYYAIPPWHANWEAEYYLDQAVRWGLRYDSQLLGHCSGVRFRDAWLAELVPILQRTAQWLGRYPSFYGFNYNDEMFFGQWVTDWKQEDKDWLKRMHETKFKGRPMADVYMHALRKMYRAFNAGVKQANPSAKVTAAPMWQFPAAEGSYPPAIYEGMDESYSHYLSEGYHYPWYPAHSVDVLRRPGKPLMGVFDNSYSGQGGDCYLQDLMQVLARGLQGAGVQHTRPFHDARGASAYRLGNLLAKWYGSIFAECPQANEAAVLYSYTQDVTEGRNSMGTPHWERVFALHTAGLMAGVPMFITYEEDVAAGWLLDEGHAQAPLERGTPETQANQRVPRPNSFGRAEGQGGPKPRVLMLFLVGQTKPLPRKVQEAIGKFIEAGGKVFTDAESGDFANATKLGFKTHELKKLWHEGYAADTIYPLFQPVQEKLAAELHKAVAKHRRFPVDTDTPWVAVNQFDGGAIRYLMLTTDEGSPYPWDAGTVWSLGAIWRFTVLPKGATLTFPATDGVVYDVFDHTLVKPTTKDGKATLPVDLRTFPGRLYALASVPLGAPRITITNPPAGSRTRTRVIECQVAVVDRRGERIPARVPLRMRLVSGRRCAVEIYRGTNNHGTLDLRIPAPTVGGQWRVEVTELLGGRASTAKVGSARPYRALLLPRPDVEGERVTQGMALLHAAHAAGRLVVVVPDAEALTDEQRQGLVKTLAHKKTKAEFRSAMPSEVSPGIYLVLGYLPRRKTLGSLLWDAWHRGLFESAVSEHVPGPGRGFGAALFAPRGRGEHCIALVGGDLDGLRKTVDKFLTGHPPDPVWVEPEELERDIAKPEPPPLPEGWVVEPPPDDSRAAPAEAGPLPRLSDLVGARLDGVRVAADGRHLLVAAKGYLRNVALVEDRGRRARVKRAVRIGQAPTVGSAWVSPDGRQFGASARVTARFGQAFHLVDARRGTTKVFAGFGDIGRATNHFAVSDNGNTVIAPGTYGVVCWKRHRVGPFWNRRDEWREAWAINYWKEFAELDWPVSNKSERIPQFHAFIPSAPSRRFRNLREVKEGGADHALILFGEFTNQGWVTPDNPCKAWLAAVDLADGKERWRFDVPIFKTLLFPTLHTSPDGSKLLLQVQMGSWNRETFRFFSVADGKALASWDSRVAPLSVAVADATGRIALVFKRRLLEMREPDGRLVYNFFWKNQPVSAAFAADGQRVYVADDAGRLTYLDEQGREVWHAELGCVASLAASGDRVHAACWDGRLRSFTADGEPRWRLDCTSALNDKDPMATVAESAKLDEAAVLQATRPPTTSDKVPQGENLLRNGRATLKLGGTPGWMSNGKLQVKAESLTNGRIGDVTIPWLPLDEVFWDATAGRQVWAEISFKEPTDVTALTVYENPNFPDSWPTEGLVQVWDEKLKRWNTAAFGVFLRGPVNTYALNLKGVRRLRYVPWNSYYRNFYTSELEVR